MKSYDAPHPVARVWGLMKQAVENEKTLKYSHEKVKSPLQAIRRHCRSCAGCPSEVRLCAIKRCDLYPYRFGTNPNLTGKRTANRHSFSKSTASASDSAPEINGVTDSKGGLS